MAGIYLWILRIDYKYTSLHTNRDTRDPVLRVQRTFRNLLMRTAALFSPVYVYCLPTTLHKTLW